MNQRFLNNAKPAVSVKYKRKESSRGAGIPLCIFLFFYKKRLKMVTDFVLLW